MECYWIDCEGIIIECGSHNKFATEYFESELGFDELMKMIEKEGVEYPYQLLHKRGWIRVGTNHKNKLRVWGNCCSPGKIMRNTMNPAMNPKQIKTVKKLCEKYNTEYLDAIN